MNPNYFPTTNKKMEPRDKLTIERRYSKTAQKLNRPADDGPEMNECCPKAYNPDECDVS